jgi:serine/threonine-protein kinase ULK4
MTNSDIRRNKSAMTPCYTSPELFSEDGAYNYKTDLWALGCIMYEMAVGQVPFFDESVGRLMSKIISEEVNFNRKELQNFSDEFVDILRRLLDKDPNSRISWNEIEKHSFWELNTASNESAKLPEENITSTNSNEYINTASGSMNTGRETNRFNTTNKTLPRKNSPKLVQDPVKDAHTLNLNKKKTVDIMRLSRNAVQNMMEDREDEYYGDRKTEVDNADQEFKFEGKENQKGDDYDSVESKSDPGQAEPLQNFDKLVKLKNPLEMSVLNVSRVIKRDKRRTTPNELEKSIFKDSEIPTFESFMIHQTDKIIKPIVGNKLIEITQQTTFNKSKLPFPQVWKIDKIKEMCKSNNIKLMEKYLILIYTYMEEFYNKGDEENLINLLNYFETIIQDKEIANNIINTTFISLFITFLSKSRLDIVKIRVCSIIAFLIRYSTVIENPLDEQGLCKVLDTLVRDKNMELSKKAAATLGEYLFFVTTQAEGEEDSSMYWKISDDSLNTLLYAIDLSRDDVVKFYAVKCIENISALTQIAKGYFTSNDSFVTKLLDIFKYSKNQELRSSAIYTISHLIRLQPKLLKNLVDKMNIIEIQKFMECESPKIQQALINIILFGMYYEPTNRSILKSDYCNKFFTYLLNFLENSNMVMKMKIILFFSLALEDVYNINQYGERLFVLLQKLRKENTSEASISTKIFENSFVLKLKQMTKNFVVLFSKLLKLNSNNNMMTIANISANKNIVEEISVYLNAFIIIGTYQKIIPSLYSAELLDCLMKMIDNHEWIDESIIKSVNEILKNFSENTTAVNDNNEVVIRKMFIPILKSSYL